MDRVIRAAPIHSGGSAAASPTGGELTDVRSGLGPGTADPHAEGAVGRTELPDQSLTGFVMQLLERRGFDADRRLIGLGGEEAGPFNQDAKHDLTHAVDIGFTTPPSLV